MELNEKETKARQRAAAWNKALADDGWIKSQIYKNSPTQQQCFKYARGGWIVHVYDYPFLNHKGWTVDICAWGPDKLSVDLPEVYDWDVMQTNLNRCTYCKKLVAVVSRLSFAGRACPACAAALAPTVEYRGWTN
jgi:hypothetical protein